MAWTSHLVVTTILISLPWRVTALPDVMDTISNLLSDLGPLIALFGEQVSKQFLAQSLGMTDSFLYAMVPIGIITGIVSAIRMKGPSWLRAVIGRSSESKTIAALELTSATSTDICELWDGQSVVRVQGSPEFVAIVHKKKIAPPVIEQTLPEHSATPPGEDARLLDSPPQSDIISISSWDEANRTRLSFYGRSVVSVTGSTTGVQAAVGDEFGETWMLERIPRPPSRKTSIPPNLTLNMSGRPSNDLRRMSSVIAILAQLSVVFIAIFQSKFSAVPPPGYMVTLYCLGTVSVNLGMFICAEAVRSVTDDEQWSLAERDANLVWIQKSQRIGDKYFPPYVIPCFQRRLYISSINANETKLLQGNVLVASILSVLGFIWQFVTLRASHWAIAVSQLGGMAAITLLRVITRIPFSRKVPTVRLPSDFELEGSTKYLVPYKNFEVFFDRSSDSTAGHFNTEADYDAVLDTRIKLGRIARDAGWSTTQTNLLKTLNHWMNKVANTVWGFSEVDDEFKEARRLYLPVSISYDISQNDDGSDIRKDKQWTFKLRRHRLGPAWSAWILDELDLEAILGLWICQLLEEYGKILGEDKTIRVPFVWAISPATPESCVDLDWWVHRGVSYFNIQVEQNASFFNHDGKPGMSSPILYEPTSHAPVDNDGLKSAFAVMTWASLPEMAARYILAGFLGSMLHHAKQISTASTVGKASSNQCTEVHLTNPEIDDLAKNCGSGELMSQSDAYNVVIPVLRSLNLIPDPMKDLKSSTLSQLRFETLLESRTENQLEVRPVPDNENYLRALAYNFMRTVYASTSRDSRGYIDSAKDLFQSGPRARAAGWKHHDDLIGWAAMKATAAINDSCESATSDSSATTTSESIPSPLGSSTKTWLADLEKELASNSCTSLKKMKKPFNILSAVERHSLIGTAMILIQLIGNGDHERLNPGLLDCMSVAIEENQLEILQLLLWHMKPTWNLNLCSTYPLVSAIRNANMRAFDMILNSGISVNAWGSDGCPALEIACEVGAKTCVTKLLEAGAKEEYPLTGKHLGPLAAAIAQGDGDICELLFKDVPEQVQRLYGSPATSAAKYGRLLMLQKLIEQGVSVEQRPMRGGRTILQAAVENGQIECLEYLLEIGAQPNAYPAPDGGLTALQAAASNGHELCIARLLDAGADVNAFASADGGLSVLQAAAHHGDENLVRLFLSKGAYVHAPATRRGLSAIQAAASGGHLVVFELLLAHGADPLAPAMQDFGRTCLQIASERGHLHIVKRILELSVATAYDPVPRVGGRTALQGSAENSHRELFEHLIAHHVGDVNASASHDHGLTALQAAAKASDLEFCQRLVELGALLNAPCADLYGLTAVQAASQSGNLELVKYLAENGADLHAPASVIGGRTALQAAAEGGHIPVVRYLLEQGVYFNERPSMEDGFRVRDKLNEDELEALKLTVPPWVWVKSKEEEIGSFDFDRMGFTGEKPLDEVQVMQILEEKISAAEEDEDTNQDEKITYPPRTWWLFHRTSAPLYIAASTGHEYSVRHVLGPVQGGKIDFYQIDSQSGRTALENASFHGHDAVVQRLLAYEEGLVDLPENAERSPAVRTKALKLATTRGHAPVVALLINAGADVNDPADPLGGRTALQAAVENNHYHVVKLLLEAGADIDAPPARVLGVTVRDLCESYSDGDKRIREILSIE